MTEYEIRHFDDQTSFEDWMHKHHATTPGLWLKIAKKASGIASISRTEALDIALCYGWIDGQSKSMDETYYLQKFTPRRPRSMWSKVNIGLVTKLIADGKMQPAGFAQIDAAKADGRWDAAYDPPSTAEPPQAFVKALKKNPKALAAYDALNKSNRYAIIWRLQMAKRPETLANRIEKIISMLEHGEKLL